MMNKTRVFLTGVIIVFFSMTAHDFYMHYQSMLREPLSKWKITFFLIVIITLVLLSLSIISIWSPRRLAIANRFRNKAGLLRWLAVVLAAVIVNYFFIFARQSELFSGTYSKLMLYLAFLVIMAWLGTNKPESTVNWQGLLVAATIMSSFFVLIFSLQKVVDYPFPLYWSEGNRFWDYSLMFGKRLYQYPYDEQIPALIDVGRQSLWGLPFLLPELSIQGMRLWNAIVFTIPYLLFGLFVFVPERGKYGQWILLGLWSLIFLNQGPIYSPLVLAAILVAGGRRLPYLLNLLLVGLASYYTYNSRITWVFAPAIWAGVAAMVEVKSANIWDKKQEFIDNRKHWLRAAGLVISGLLGGIFIPDILPGILTTSNEIISAADTSFINPDYISAAGERQPLLWERLLPNPTNPAGIIPGLLLAAAPLIALLVIFALRRGWKLNLWQKLAILGSLLVFLAVGFIVSVKIGGGSNLHNLDMFFIGLLFVAALAWEGGAKDWLENPDSLPWWINVLLLTAIILPVGSGIMTVEPFYLPQKEVVDEALDHITQKVAEAKQQGEVLFLDHRQLLTFGYIENVPLVPEYEKKWMMDEAMANNAEYFEQFNKDMAQHRFSLIVSERLSIKYQGDEYEFGNENDAWVRWVSTPILCYYEIYETYEEVSAQLLVPRKKLLDDAAVNCPKP